MSPEGSNRPARVAERVRSELMQLILRGVVRDPGAAGVFISAVTVSGDLRHARVYVRLTEIQADERRRQAALVALRRASGYLRRELAPRLGLRYLPELKFFWDEKVDEAARVESLLAEIRSDAGRDGDGDRDGGGEG